MEYENNVNKIYITTNEGDSQEVPLKIIKNYTFITDQLDNLDDLSAFTQANVIKNEPRDHTFTVPFSAEDIQLVVEYTKKIVAEGEETDEEAREKLVNEFNTMIKSLGKDELDRIIQLADYLSDEKLIDRICDGIVLEIVNKTPDQIRERYNLKEELSPEEKEKIEEDFDFLFNKNKAVST